jgi:hypothetical protein
MRSLLALLMLINVTSCATSGTMERAPLDEGVERTYDGAYHDVREAARHAIKSSGLQLDKAEQIDPTTWVMYASKGATAFSWGERVRVVVDEVTPGENVVRVYTKRKLATNVTAKGDWAPMIFGNMDLALK